ncbi:MAG TPA: hypothetical protein VNH11_13150 [Pirellulales bacterium]|nr:hypothetical protein [Pirellulales bacterium]
MHPRTLLLSSLLFLVPSLVRAQDLLSGPDVGQPVPGLSVLAATGSNAGNEIDYADQRKEKPTVYVFIQADKWDRPVARFLSGLDEAMPKISQEAYVVATWLTADQEKTKQYLPVAQQSLRLANSALTQFTGASGPAAWKLHSGAHVTAVVVVKGTVAANFAYRSVNETVVHDVLVQVSRFSRGSFGQIEIGLHAKNG